MEPGSIYAFGPFRLDPVEKVLRREGQPLPLSPRALEMLLVLVQRSGQVVQKEEMLRLVWPDTFVEEGNLTVHMSALRKALGDVAEGSAYIETLPRRGYRFCLPVEVLRNEPPLMVVERLKETRIVREEIVESLPAQSSMRRPLVILAVGALVVAAGVVGWRMAQRTFASVTPMRVLPFAAYPGGVHMPAFAPDGERIAFPWTGPDGKNWDIYVKLIGNDPPLQLTATSDSDGAPAWSPDGRHVAFLRENREKEQSAIYIVGALGGPERKLMDLPFGRYFDLDWSPDGKFIATAIRMDPHEPYNSHRFMAVFLVDVQTLEKRQLTFPKDPERDQRFAFSPDGKTLAFIRNDGETSGIWLVPVAGGNARRLFWERTWIGHLAWSAEGESIIFTSEREGGNKLFRLSLSGGAPVLLPLSEDHAYYPTVAKQGNRMAFVRLETDDDLWALRLTTPTRAAGAAEVFRSTARAESSPEFSPDGQWLAFTNEGSGKKEVWLARADGSSATPLTDFQPAPAFAPAWSPDSKELAFTANKGPQGAKGGTFVINIETRALRRLTEDAFAVPWWSRDGKWIYLCLNPLRGKAGIWKVPSQGGAPVRVSETDGLLAQESADGKTLYFMRTSGGIWKMPVSGGTANEVIHDFTNDQRGFWRVTPTGIYYVAKSPHATYELSFFDFAQGKSRAIAPLSGPCTEFSGGVTISPDGKLVLYSKVGREASEIALVESPR